MALKAFGAVLSIQIVPNSARVSRKRNGLEEGECTFECIGDSFAAGNLLQASRPLGMSHPYYSWLYMETQEVTFMGHGARMRCSYAGVQYQYLEIPSYSLQIGMEESPIETHYNFNDIAGKPSAPINGAIFLDPETGSVTTDNAVGVFDRFATYKSDGSKNPKGGIEAFLDPVVIYRENYVTFGLPGIGDFGKIVNDVPGPGFRGSLGRRNWLYLGFSYTRRGDPNGYQSRVSYEISREWKLSGRNGWDADIYG